MSLSKEHVVKAFKRLEHRDFKTFFEDYVDDQVGSQ